MKFCLKVFESKYNMYIYFEENDYENNLYKISTISFKPKFVKL